jgi:prevent-host-death family protein
MSVPISKFKAQCLAMLEAVNRTGKPLRVTRFGKPLVDIVPATVSAPPSWLGLLQGDGEIVGDVMEPVLAPGGWEVMAEPARKSSARARKRPR